MMREMERWEDESGQLTRGAGLSSGRAGLQKGRAPEGRGSEARVPGAGLRKGRAPKGLITLVSSSLNNPLAKVET